MSRTHLDQPPLIILTKQSGGCLPDSTAASQRSTQEQILHPEDTSKAHPKSQKKIELTKLDEDLVAAVVESHLAEVFRSAIENQREEGLEEEPLGLTSVLSELQIKGTPDSSKVVTPQKFEIKQNNGDVRLTINLIASNRESLALQPANPSSNPSSSSCSPPLSCEFTLKNQGRAAEATFITFGLFSLQNKFQILSASPIETMIRRKSSLHPVRELFAFCCLGSRTTQVYQFRQHVQRPQTVVLSMIEGSQEEFSGFCQQLKRKLWDINQILLTQQQSLKLFLSTQKTTTLAQLRQQLQDYQKKPHRRSDEYLLEVCLQRVIETADALVDAYAVRTNSVIANGLSEVTKIARFVFDQAQLMGVYRKVERVKEEGLQGRKKKVLASMWYEQVWERLRVDEGLRLCDKRVEEKERVFPYKPSIAELQRLPSCILPSEKLQCISLYFQHIKTSYEQFHKTQLIIDDLDYILPVHIFCLLYSKVDSVYANLRLMQYFNKRNDRGKGEMQILTGLELAADYIGGQGVF